MYRAALALAAACLAAATVPQLDQSRYLGRWFQMYSDFAVDATFENSSYCDTADYGLNPNGTISVLNRERQYSVDGPERRILGWAAATDPAQPGQLTVYLQTTDFPAPYWVYALGPPTYTRAGLYEYSIVSDPLKLTLFVLARNATEFAAKWGANVTAYLAAEGFTNILNKPIPTVQQGCTYWV
jgi:apolipoprotein D and lipocalin family protein